MVITPDVPTLPCIEKKGVKYFELVAEPVLRELLPGLYIKALGYNGTTPGPTILAYPGDYVNIRVHNRLHEPTSVHWHGLDVPNVMDGDPDNEPTPKIEPGSYFDYHFKIINPPGTHMYHTHHRTAKQEMAGLGGGFIILDPKDYKGHIQRDYFIILQEWAVQGLAAGELKPGIYAIDPLSNEFNFFTMNGRSLPFTTPLPVKYGEKVRIRLGNIVDDAHPIHIHGHQFYVTSADGNKIPPGSRLKKNTILVASGETYDIEFVANNPGIWSFHCHIPHHMANNMSLNREGGMFTRIVYVQ